MVYITLLLEINPDPEIQRVTENNYPPRKNKPFRKSLQYPEKSIESGSASIKRVKTHVISLHWNGNALSSAIGFGGEAWSLPGAFAFLHSFVQRLKGSLRHWNPLHSVSENMWFSPQFGQHASKCIRAVFESTRYVVTRLKAFCLPLLTGRKLF